MIPKFRAYSKKHEKLFDISLQEIIVGDDCIFYHPNMPFVDSVEIALMQSTGLYDKNGVEIFEGDIVKISNNLQENVIDYNAQIVFKDGGFCAIDGVEDNYFIRRYNLHTFDLELEIIGNVHEHPHLLNT